MAVALSAWAGPGRAVDAGPLVLEATIPLGDVRGRIDHLAIDDVRKRLFVAELGNNSVAVVDLVARTVLHRIAGLSEPQGVGYVPSTDTLFVANGGDGSVRIFRGEDYAPSGRIDLGEDADNIRVDLATNILFVGYGAGRLAAIDPMNRKKIADIPLPAHPEGFQISRNTEQIFVNVPSARSIVVIKRRTGQQSALWKTDGNNGNFPMAIDEASGHVLVGFRTPPRLAVFVMTTGERVAEVETCGDADDLFFDAKRGRAYVICGAGFIDTFGSREVPYANLTRVPTSSGARTGLLIPAMDRLALAVRAAAGEPAAILIYRPVP